MNIHKIISVVLHPIVMPTAGTVIYFLILPLAIPLPHKLSVLALIFSSTYVLPLILLLVLKKMGVINDLRVHSIKERRMPMVMMVLIFYTLAVSFQNVFFTRDLSTLFYGTIFGLSLTHLSNYFKVKSSLHLMSIGSATAFFILFQYNYAVNILPIIIVFVILSGFLGSARLYLRAHTLYEVFQGFFLGVFCQVVAYFLV